MILLHKENLLNLIQHCMSQEETVRTPSDFTAHEDLTQEELDDLFEVLEEKSQ